MTNYNPTPRSALTAIAAVLALGSTSAMAQDAASSAQATAPVGEAIVIPGAQPTVAPSTVVPLPSATLPPVTVAPPAPSLPQGVSPVASQKPVPATVPVLPRIADAPEVTTEEPTAEAAAPIRPAPRAERSPSANRESRAIEAQAPTADTSVSAATEAAAGEPTADVALAPQLSTAPILDAPAAANNGATAIEPDNRALALIGGTGILLVLGGGFYALRRRRTVEPREAHLAGASTSDHVAPVEPLRPATATPVTHASAAPPAQSRATTGSNNLAALVTAAPSSDNPFLTRKNRIRRANFLLRHGHAPHATSMINEQVEQQTATRGAADRKPVTTGTPNQLVYSFGTSAPKPPVIRKPATT